jgi:hypothetical protein
MTDTYSAIAAGAIGDGITDDTIALQNWINTCQTDGRVGYLDAPPVSYKITSILNITDRVTLKGAGQRSMIAPDPSIGVFNINTFRSVYLRDFRISYPSAGLISAAAITLTASGAGVLNTGSVFERVVVQIAGNAFKIGQAQYFSIVDCIVQNITAGGSAVLLDNTGLTNPDQGDSAIRGCTFALPGTATGISISSFAGLRISDCKFIGDGTSSTAINMQLKNSVASSLLMITGNSFEGKTNGIVLQRLGSNASFANLIINSNEFEPMPNGAAVLIPTDVNGKWITNAVMNNNIVFGPQSGTNYGFVAKAVEGLTISGNVITSNNSSGSMQKIASAGSNHAVLGPNCSGGVGIYTASDLGATTSTVFSPT